MEKFAEIKKKTTPKGTKKTIMKMVVKRMLKKKLVKDGKGGMGKKY